MMPFFLLFKMNKNFMYCEKEGSSAGNPENLKKFTRRLAL